MRSGRLFNAVTTVRGHQVVPDTPLKVRNRRKITLVSSDMFCLDQLRHFIPFADETALKTAGHE